MAAGFFVQQNGVAGYSAALAFAGLLSLLLPLSELLLPLSELLLPLSEEVLLPLSLLDEDDELPLLELPDDDELDPLLFELL